MFWDSGTLKRRARNVLTGHYWIYLLAVAVCALITSHSLRVSVRIDIRGKNFRSLEDLINYLIMMWNRYYPSILSSLAVSGIGKTIWKIFAANPFDAGSCRFRTLATYGKYDFQSIFSAFSEGRYKNTVVALFLRDVFLTLWSLLLIVPGIIKSYSYFMVPYIMAENPGVSWERAFQISKTVTRGEKWRMFLMDLSFLGWYILGALCLGVGILFVLPYHSAARAELYGALRFKAASQNLCSREEIGAELFS